MRLLKEPGIRPTLTRCIKAVGGEASDPAGPREVPWDSSGPHEGERLPTLTTVADWIPGRSVERGRGSRSKPPCHFSKNWTPGGAQWGRGPIAVLRPGSVRVAVVAGTHFTIRDATRRAPPAALT